MSIPANLKYTKEHEWVRVEGDVAYVGIARTETGFCISILHFSFYSGIRIRKW